MTGKYERVVLERRVLDRPLRGGDGRRHARGVRRRRADVVLSRRAARRRSRPGSSAASSRWSCSIGAASRRRCSAGSAPARSTVRTAACRWSCTARAPVRGARAATTATTRSRVPATCPTCAAPYLEQAGLRHRARRGGGADACVPAARVARVDRDAIRRRGALAALLARFRGGEIDILVGTQMIAKGHDFPRGHAGRRHLGRRRPRHGGLPRLRAHVSAADAGGGARRSRRAAGRGDRPDALSRALQHPARVPAGLSGVLRAGARSSGGDALSAGWCRSINVVVRARTFAAAMDDAADVVAAAAATRDCDAPFQRARSGAGAARPAARRVPRAVPREGHATARAMREALTAALAEQAATLARRTTDRRDPLSVL